MTQSDILTTLESGDELPDAGIAALASWLLDESASVESKAGALRAFARKGESPGEIAGLVKAFLGHAVRPPLEVSGLDRPAMDVCGTGGDRLGLFNVSSTAMFVLAGGGVAVVKHGNRGITSKCGGADVLEALGVAIDLPPDRFAECVKRHGAGFMLAPQYHPAFRAVAPVRKLLAAEGTRTVFNIIGPLLNPVQPPRQLAGVFDPALPPVYIDILRQLGRQKAWAVHGTTPDGGMDEISTLGENIIAALEDGEITEHVALLSLDTPDLADLRGGDAAGNAAILEGILEGNVRGARRDLVLANASAGFQVAGLAMTWDDGIAKAAEVIDSGRAAEALQVLRTFR